MSVRSKKTHNTGLATNGSLYSTSIDLKPGVRLPHGESVGVMIVDGDKANGSFLIKMYYGVIELDPDTRLDKKVLGATFDRENYLRFRVNYLNGFNSQSTVGKMIQKGVSTELKDHGFEQVELSTFDHKGKRVHVCGNESASYFVQAFLQNQSFDLHKPDFEVLASAIAGGVNEDQPFYINDDLHMYTYSVTEVTESSASMRVTRAS